ncbi:hypothetical protein ACWF50_15415 [Brucella pseudogrignonensis]
MSKLTTAKLKAAYSAARRHHVLNLEIHRAFEERYGVTYSDVDEDWLIDSLEQGASSVTLKQCDKLMTENGYPPIIRPTGVERG